MKCVSAASGIDISQNGISYIERNLRAVRDYELTALAEILEVSPLWLLYGDDVPLDVE